MTARSPSCAVRSRFIAGARTRRGESGAAREAGELPRKHGRRPGCGWDLHRRGGHRQHVHAAAGGRGHDRPRWRGRCGCWPARPTSRRAGPPRRARCSVMRRSRPTTTRCRTSPTVTRSFVRRCDSGGRTGLFVEALHDTEVAGVRVPAATKLILLTRHASISSEPTLDGFDPARQQRPEGVSARRGTALLPRTQPRVPGVDERDGDDRAQLRGHLDATGGPTEHLASMPRLRVRPSAPEPLSVPGGIERTLAKLEDPMACAARDGRDHRDLVAVGERRRRIGVVAVPREAERRTSRAQDRVADDQRGAPTRRADRRSPPTRGRSDPAGRTS